MCVNYSYVWVDGENQMSMHSLVDIPWLSDNSSYTVMEILELSGSESTLNIAGIGPCVQEALRDMGIDTVAQLVDYCREWGHPSVLKTASRFCVDVLIFKLVWNSGLSSQMGDLLTTSREK